MKEFKDENRLYRVDLIESERGFGKKLFDAEWFIEEANALKYIKEYNSKNNLETVPSYYTFAELYGLVEVEMNLEDACDYVSNKIIVLYKEFKPSGKWTYDKELEVHLENPNDWDDIINIIKEKHRENIKDGYSYLIMESKCGKYGYPHLIKG